MKRISKSQLKKIRDDAEIAGIHDVHVSGEEMRTLLAMLADAQTHGRRIQDAAVKLIRERAVALGTLRSLEATYESKACRQVATRIEEMSLAQALKENP